MSTHIQEYIIPYGTNLHNPQILQILLNQEDSLEDHHMVEDLSTDLLAYHHMLEGDHCMEANPL
jgi:hypothetical protein